MIKSIWFLQFGLMLFVGSRVCVATAQISEYEDCSEIYHHESKFKRPLTQKEKSELLENAFYERLSTTTKCIDPSSKSESSAAGQGPTGGRVDGTASRSLSRNILDHGDKSVAIAGSIGQAPSTNFEASSDRSEAESGNGREHLDLTDVDNKAILMAQIKAQADSESDPEIKKRLMEQYEGLK